MTPPSTPLPLYAGEVEAQSAKGEGRSIRITVTRRALRSHHGSLVLGPSPQCPREAAQTSPSDRALPMSRIP
jgi:hypothetical protein